MKSAVDQEEQEVTKEPIHHPGWYSILGLSDYVAIDLETTGLDPREEQIIEVGAVRFINGKPAEEFQTFISCPKPLDPFIIDLTGITDYKLVGAPSFRDISEQLQVFISDSVLVGQNVDFDLQFLSAAGRSTGNGLTENPFAFRGTRVLDTSMLARTFWPEFTKEEFQNILKEYSERERRHGK